MFSFLKKKIKETVSKISKKIEKEPSEEIIKEKPKEKKGILKKVKEKVTTKKISADKFEELFYDLELTLLENNVALEVIEKIKQDLKQELVDKPLKRTQIESLIKESLKKSLEKILSFEKIDLIKLIKSNKEKPYVIVFVGVNGSGKTTSISKVANLILKNKLSCVLVAADTFRAASIEQLEEWGKKLGVKVIKHQYGADPCAVAFDGKSYGKAHNIDVVLIDTAGRQHSNINLIQQMEKITRVIKPDLKIFVGESITGNDAIFQAQEFNKSISIDCIILSKADIDEKGGTAISVSYVTGKPIIYIGTGQTLKDLKEFDKNEIMKNLGF
jgi:fused signal recognition particle receptor